MSYYDFELKAIGLNLTNINDKIYNKPKISLSSRDEFTYFSFYAKDLKLKVASSIEFLLKDTTFLTVKRNSEMIATYYCKAKSIEKDDKNRIINVSFQSEFARVKDVSLSETTYYLAGVPKVLSAAAVLNRAIGIINNDTDTSGYYSWSAGNISSSEIKLKGNFPLYDANGNIKPNTQQFYYHNSKYYAANPASTPRVYLEIDTTNNVFLSSTTTYDDWDVAQTSPTSVPFAGSKSALVHGGNGIIYHDDSEALGYVDYPCVYDEFSPFDSPTINYDDSDKIGDVLLDLAKISDSIVTILDRTIYFHNLSSADVHNFTNNEFLILNRKEKIREHYDFSELSLKIQDSTPSSSKPILLNSLKYYYEKRFDTEMPIFELEVLTNKNVKVGYELQIDSSSFGRVVSVDYSTQNSNLVKVKTEKSEHYQ